MPVISVKLARGRSRKQKQELVKALTEEAARMLEVEPSRSLL